MAFKILNKEEEMKYCIIYDDEEYGDNYKNYKPFDELRAKPDKMEKGYLFRPFGAFKGIIVPSGMAANKRLQQGSKLVFGLLIYYHGNNNQGAFVSQGSLAEDLSVSRRQINRYVRELKQLKYIKTEPAKITDPSGEEVKELQTNGHMFVWNKDLEDSLPDGDGSRGMHKNRTRRIGDPYDPHKLFKGPYVPEYILGRDELNNGEKLCYGYLSHVLSKTGDAFPSMREIGEQLGVSKATANNYVKALESEEYIDVIRADGEEKLRNRRNRYKFIWREFFKSALKKNAEGIRLDSNTVEYKSWKKHQYRRNKRLIRSSAYESSR